MSAGRIRNEYAPWYLLRAAFVSRAWGFVPPIHWKEAEVSPLA